MAIFKDSVCGTDKKHLLWQHYINGDLFSDEDTDEIKVQSDPRLVLPTEDGGEPITKEKLHQWLNRVLPKLKPEEQIALYVICIKNKGFHVKHRLYNIHNGQLPFGEKRNKIMQEIMHEVQIRKPKFKTRFRVDNSATLISRAQNIVIHESTIRNLFIRALNEGVNELTSSKETATMLFACLTGFASGAVPGISLGALGYTLAFGASFALGATPVGWLIGGAILFGLVGAIAIYTYNYFSKKHDDKSHKAIYTKNDTHEQVKQTNSNTTAIIHRLEMQDKKIDTLTKLVEKLISAENAEPTLRRNSDVSIASLENSVVTPIHKPTSPNKEPINISDSVTRRKSIRSIGRGKPFH